MRMNFSTQNLRTVFAQEDKYEAFRKLCYNLNHGIDVYLEDEDGNERKVTKKEANKAVAKVFREICGISEEDARRSPKMRKRAIEDHHREIYEIIEEDVDFKVETGFRESEWFNDYVNYKNQKLGDANEFWTKQNIMLNIAKVAGDMHDYTLQNLNEGESFSIHTSKYAAKVGKDLDLILLDRVDFTELTDKIAEAYLTYIQAECFGAVYDAAEKLPVSSEFVKTGALGKETKDKFDLLLEKVGVSNGNKDVVIMGTKTALKKINALALIDWRSEGQKEKVANLGHLGSYESTELIEIPQRFAINDVTQMLIPNDVLLIFPKDVDPFVNMFDVGETEITDKGSTKGDLADDFRTYEVQREFGIGVNIYQNIGRWTLE